VGEDASQTEGLRGRTWHEVALPPARGPVVISRLAARLKRGWEELVHRAWVKTLQPRCEGSRYAVGRRVLPFSVQHVHGPKCVDAAPDEIVATCVMRNGALHARTFLEHHRSLGIRHFIILDNGSDDESIDIISTYPEVVLLRSTWPYARYENAFKEYLSRTYAYGRWNLCVDIDELWDYPRSSRLPINSFLSYLDHHGYDAVVCQMLDMFAELPLHELQSSPADDLRGCYRYYDLADIVTGPYPFGDVPNDSVRMHYHGIRYRVFGTTNWLTKAALVRIDDRDRLYVSHHHANPAALADVTAVLLHYPFVASFQRKVEDAARERRYGGGATKEYVRYQQVLSTSNQLRLWRPGALTFMGVDRLVEEGFLTASDRYTRWVADQTSSAPPAD
jgi:glycosyltransferase involved in cell wall biosynthesis